VDTGVWFASVDLAARDHETAVNLIRGSTEPLITTDYVVDETLTLLRARGQNSRAVALGELFFAGTLTTIHFLTEQEILRSWETFRRFSDKRWSFTGCASRIIIETMGIAYA
jgi:uncharacterized protein